MQEVRGSNPRISTNSPLRESFWLRSTMDSAWVSGTQNLGSIPSGATFSLNPGSLRARVFLCPRFHSVTFRYNRHDIIHVTDYFSGVNLCPMKHSFALFLLLVACLGSVAAQTDGPLGATRWTGGASWISTAASTIPPIPVPSMASFVVAVRPRPNLRWSPQECTIRVCLKSLCQREGVWSPVRATA